MGETRASEARGKCSHYETRMEYVSESSAPFEAKNTICDFKERA
jgi:hypothetical protein